MRSVFLILGLAAALVGCGTDKSADDASSNPKNSASPNTEYVAPDSKGIQTEAARTSAIPEYLDLPAHIEADPTRVVHVFAPAGGRIVEMKVRPWDRVEKGQTLAMLESSDLARAVADYHKALADHQVKQKALVRARRTCSSTTQFQKKITSRPRAMRSSPNRKSRPRANKFRCSAWTLTMPRLSFL